VCYVPERRQPREGKLRFSADSQLLFQLGEQLVARRSIALAELVKNAYDADATEVVVTFESVTAPGGTIIVEDNGEGMTLEVIERAWMRIATVEKERNPVSSTYHRQRTGSKGIGRFACRRLADRLEIRSIAHAADGSGAKEEIQVTFEWGEFAAGTDVGEVPVVYRRRAVPPDEGTGVRLTLSDVSDVWREDDLKEMRRDLLTLQPPFPVSRVADGGGRDADPGFAIAIESLEFPEQTGGVSDNVRRAAWGQLDGAIDEEGRPRYVYKIRGRHSVSWEPPQRFPAIGAFKFRAYHFIYNSEHLEGTSIGLREAQRLGRDHGGVRVYMDGFRVFPYGESRDDWLDLDRDRGRRRTDTPSYLSRIAGDVEEPLLHLPGNNQVFGVVAVSRARNPGLKQKASREGFLDSAAFAALRDAVRLGFNWMTVPYAREELRLEAGRKKHGAALPGKVDPTEPIREAREAVLALGDTIPAESRVQVLQMFDMAELAVKRQQEDRITQVSLLRALASTGVMVAAFEHEFGATIAGLRRVEADLQGLALELSGGLRKLADSIRTDLERQIDSIKEQREVMGVLLGREGRAERIAFALRPFVEQLKKTYGPYLGERGIDFDDGVPASLRLPPMFACEVESVLVNLMTNAVKELLTEGGQPSKRAMKVQASLSREGVEILFMDTGRGLPREKWEEVFEPLVSYSRVGPDLELGTGTGLGLTIVRDIVQVYGGSASFVDPPPGWGACVRIFLPKER
jgi:signal transduction histidine kinase